MKKYYLGIDVSKGYADFVIIDNQRTLVEENFQLDDTFPGHCKLYEILFKLIKSNPEVQIYAGVESTGGYENNWYNALIRFKRTLPLCVVRLNPVGVHHNLKASLMRNITDKISALGIAEYLLLHSAKIRYDEQDGYSELRKHWKFIEMLTKQRVAIENQLESVLYSANTEILHYCKSSKPAWLYKVLLKYPTAEKLSRARVANLKKIEYLKDDVAEKILAAARQSVSSNSGPATEQLIIDMINQIFHIEEVIKRQMKLISDSCKLEEVEILKSFKGIGIQSALGLILEIGFIERFASVKAIVSYFGVHPEYKQSGDGKWGNHMSKKGRKTPRAILYMVAFSAITHNPLIKDVYQRNLAKGMTCTAAIGVCMHKVLRIIYGMLKNKTRFNPAIDKENQQRSIKATVEIVPEDRNRRYQPLDENAPISRRQTKKRKAQNQSHNDNKIKNGIMPEPITNYYLKT